MKGSRGATVLISGTMFLRSLAPLESYALSCPAIDDVSLDADQAQLILQIKNRDSLADAGALLTLLGPALDCIASHPAVVCFRSRPAIGIRSRQLPEI
jgi:hypothetical protein